MSAMDREYSEMEAPLLESAPLPEKRRSTLLTVCPFILGKPIDETSSHKLQYIELVQRGLIC